MNPFEILGRTPKTNCRQCGQLTCLAFAALVAKSGVDPKKCPFINLSGLEIESKKGSALEELAQERDFELIEYLKSKIAVLDFLRIAPGLGAACENDTLFFNYLGQRVQLSKKQVLLDQKEPEDPRDQILLYNYVHSEGGRSPLNNWVGLESLPNSISKVKTLATYCEDRLASLFSGKPQNLLIDLGESIGGIHDPSASATAGIIFPVLPMVPQYLLFWDAEPAEGFDAKVKILFDRNVMDFLDLESLVFSAERLADRLAYRAQKHCPLW